MRPSDQKQSKLGTKQLKKQAAKQAKKRQRRQQKKAGTTLDPDAELTRLLECGQSNFSGEGASSRAPQLGPLRSGGGGRPAAA